MIQSPLYSPLIYRFLPVGILYWAAAFCTGTPFFMALKAWFKSFWLHEVVTALKGWASSIPSFLAILYKVWCKKYRLAVSIEWKKNQDFRIHEITKFVFTNNLWATQHRVSRINKFCIITTLLIISQSEQKVHSQASRSCQLIFRSKLYIPSTLNIALLVAHTFECVCSKINHGLNHGLFILLLKLINCPIHWIVYK